MPIPTATVETVTSLETLKRDILASKDPNVCLDTETTGLRWMAGDRAFGLAVSWDDKAAFLRNEVFSPEKMGLLISDLYGSEKDITFHNAEFDLHMIRESYGVEAFPNHIVDTLRIGHLLDSGADHSLKGWSRKVFGPAVSYYEDQIAEYRKRYKIKDYSRLPSVILDPYACNDAILTKALVERFGPDCQRDYPRWYEIEHDLIPVITRMERTGLRIDIDYIQKRQRKLLREEYEIEKKIARLVGKPLNIGSPAQISQYFYSRMGIRLQDTSGNDTGETSTGVEILKAIIDADPEAVTAEVAQLLIAWRAVNKERTTYMDSYLELAVNGRLHPHWNACGTITGRFSGSGPNPQNIPRNLAVRRCFIPDRWFVDFDFSQIEYRMASFAAKQESMVQAFIDGLDFHAFTAGAVFGKDIADIDKDERTIGKTINFLTLYGGGAEKFAIQAGISIPEAEVYLRAYWKTNSNLDRWVKRTIDIGKREGHVFTLLGRKVPLQDRPYAAPNYVIQGTAGDILKIALLRTSIVAEDLGVNISNTVHDQIVFDGLEHSDVPRIVEQMESFNFEDKDIGLTMPIIVDVKDSTKSWGDMGEEWKPEEKYSGQKNADKKPKARKRKLLLEE